MWCKTVFQEVAGERREERSRRGQEAIRVQGVGDKDEQIAFPAEQKKKSEEKLSAGEGKSKEEQSGSHRSSEDKGGDRKLPLLSLPESEFSEGTDDEVEIGAEGAS